MAKYIAESKWIYSIWPGKLEPLKCTHGPDPSPRGGRCTTYWIAPVPPRSGPASKPKGIEVSDMFENVLNPMEEGHNRWMSKPVPYGEIVEFILRQWTGNMVGIPAGYHPGIMSVIGSVPTQAELDNMKETQTRYCEFLFQQAERLSRENLVKEITENMRTAAIWLGRPRLWSDPALASAVKDCPECKQTIPDDAKVCHFCHTRLLPMSAEIAAINATPQLRA